MGASVVCSGRSHGQEHGKLEAKPAALQDLQGLLGRSGGLSK